MPETRTSRRRKMGLNYYRIWASPADIAEFKRRAIEDTIALGRPVRWKEVVSELVAAGAANMRNLHTDQTDERTSES